MIRIWSGGRADYGHYYLDFYDEHRKHAVNTPDNYKIVHVPFPGAQTFGGELVSWEASWGVSKEELRPREEKYRVPESTRLALLRDGLDPFYFRIPTSSRGNVEFSEPRVPGPLYE